MLSCDGSLTPIGRCQKRVMLVAVVIQVHQRSLRWRCWPALYTHVHPEVAHTSFDLRKMRFGAQLKIESYGDAVEVLPWIGAAA